MIFKSNAIPCHMPRESKSRMVTMRVIASSLPGDGVVRIPEDSFKELKIKPGDKVSIEAPLKGRVEAVALADSIYTVNGIRIRHMDLERLGIGEGDGVMVKPLQKGSKGDEKAKK
jgi:formylmethanofuran dehydrogenase subunit D